MTPSPLTFLTHWALALRYTLPLTHSPLTFLHCKKSHRHIPMLGPDEAGPNGWADGKCFQLACLTFPTCSVTHVGKMTTVFYIQVGKFLQYFASK
jgi:hypothetical protein